MSETLRAYIAAHGLDETAVMNLLQEHGKCSDTAVWAQDVGNGGQSVQWLHRQDAMTIRLLERPRKEAA